MHSFLATWSEGEALRPARRAAVALVAALLLVAALGPASALAADREAPSAPADLVADGGSNEVALSWPRSTDDTRVTGYNIWRRLALSPTGWERIAQSATNRYTDKTADNGTSYAYAVRAYDAAENISAASPIASARPGDPPTTGPSSRDPATASSA
jgi:hypothetical protein